MRAAVYVRVSTERRGRDQTIDSQLEALRGRTASHGHELQRDHVYIDEGYSGSRLDRPALDRLRDAAREGEFDAVGVYSPDRLARRYAYQVVLLEELRKAGSPVEFAHRPISDDPHDQLLLQIQGAVAEYERAQLGERFRRGKLRKARADHRVAGQAPYGDRYVPAHLEVDHAEAAVVRQLHRWLADERMTVRQILKRLAAGPVRPGSGKRLWSTSVVHRILSDPVYTGTGYANRHVFVAPRKPRATGRRAGEPTCQQPRPREEWIPIRIPAIIDEATHRDSQSQLDGNSALSFRNNTRNDYLLRCLLTCRTRGLAMFGVTRHDGGKRREYRYYTCHGKDTVARDRDCRCTQSQAKVDELDAAVWGHVKALLEGPATLATRLEELARVPAEKDGERASAQRWEAQLQRLAREGRLLVDASQAEVIDLAELKARREQIRGRREVLTTQRDQEQRLQDEQRAARAVWSDLEASCRRMRSRLDESSRAERQRILQLLIERGIVGEVSPEIRHVIPLGGAGGEPSGPGPEETPGTGDGEGRGPEEEPGPRPICRLRSDGMRPAILVLLDPVVAGEAVIDRDLRPIDPQDRPGHVRPPVVGDREGGQVVGQADPEPRLPIGLGPRGLVDVCRRGLLDRGGHPSDDRLQDFGGPPLQLGDHAERDAQPEQVGGQLLDRPLGQPVRAGEHGEDRPQTRAERPGRHARQQFSASDSPATGAGQPVEAVLIDIGSDRRDLGDLMPHRIGVASLEGRSAAPAQRRPDLEGLPDLLGWDACPNVPLVAGLATPLPPGRRDGRPSLDLHGGRVGRRRLGRVGGVLVKPGFQVSDPLLQGGNDGQNGRLGLRG